MTTEARPRNDHCNIDCDYCYQKASRDSGNKIPDTDLEAMLGALTKVGQDFVLFGGEALTNTMTVLDRLFKYGFETYGKNGLQTNGTLINKRHLAMFKKYNVNVGVSIDGPNELNSLRKARGDVDGTKTLKNTKKTMENIVKLVENGINTSIIITLHRVNGSKEALPRLLKFIRWLGDIGVKNGNLHVLEVDKTMVEQEKNVLTQEENIGAFLEIAKFMDENPDLNWNPFRDMYNVLQVGGDTNCTWNFCDPMNTQAVYGVESDGSIGNCGRTNKEGIGWHKADDNFYARYISLYNTPQDMEGCKGCRFWSTCGGSCPGESINNDFRNKTIHCSTQKAMLTFYENKLISQGIEPISQSDMLPMVEKIILRDMANANYPSLQRAVAELRACDTEDIVVPVRKDD